MTIHFYAFLNLVRTIAPRTRSNAGPGLGSGGNLSRMGDEAPEEGTSYHDLKMGMGRQEAPY